MREWLKNLMYKAAHEMGAEIKQMGAHGSHEASALLFNGSAFVMYPRGHHDDPQIGKADPEVQPQELQAQKNQPQIEREM